MEEKSITSSIRKSVGSKGTRSKEFSDEESGWTTYFEDLSNQPKTYSSTFSCGSSLISDAATAPKISHHNHHVSASSSSPKPPNILRFKQTRTTEICEDHSLEDTASSPVNSSKGSNFKSHDMNPRKREEDQIHSFPGEGNYWFRNISRDSD
ncbi:hypothetical protein ERO13_D02G134300v2 [Gossypium hirsutum]|uniref:Uncharacterized protein n=1 Tax=Gossypium hirsutum TaxID=3635 RepID=A0A1U8JL53_GOSHI|nr:vascular-related unknown protein 1-like [Gossypium hirsutum]KAG4158695.1 hypothetical protein ERO13_D02G134300v2 [Gossypium hirsutum]